MSFENITVQTLKAMIDSGEEFQLIDVRNDNEVANGIISGAKHIALPTLPIRLSEIDTSKKTVIYCALGGRSGQACGLASEKLNFPNGLFNVSGGITAWQGSGFAIVSA